MARRSGSDVITVSVRGHGRVARDLRGLKRDLQDEMVRELRIFGGFAREEFRDAAPGPDTGQLEDAIDFVPHFRAARPRGRIIVEDLEGHGGDTRDYLDVTRYGHRKTRIRPRQATVLKVHVAGHRNPHAAVYRQSVEGHRPVGDWVERAGPDVERLADDAQRRLGRRVDRRFHR